MFKTLEDAKAFCEERQIRMVDFMMVDLDGRWRHLSLSLIHI